jgi:hypothetical protein
VAKIGHSRKVTRDPPGGRGEGDITRRSPS